MSRAKFMVVCSLFLLVVLGASVLSAQTGGAMLYANGNVKVNGQAAGAVSYTHLTLPTILLV